MRDPGILMKKKKNKRKRDQKLNPTLFFNYLYGVKVPKIQLNKIKSMQGVK